MSVGQDDDLEAVVVVVFEGAFSMRHRWCDASCRWAVMALAVGVGAQGLSGAAHAGGHGNRPVPVNAVQPPGASFEGYPVVGGAQRVRILEEGLHASIEEQFAAPIRSTWELTSRTAERLAVRAREILPINLPRPFDPRGDEGPCGSDLGGGFGGPPTPALLTLLPSSELSVRTARCRLDLMMYGWDDDPTGRAVAAALAERARAGVPVRVLVDRTGYLIHNAPAAQGCCTFLDELRAVPNVRVIEPPGTFFRFDHRKVAIVDERVVWTGGMILTEVARRRWHNLAFLAEGSIVAAYTELFNVRWAEVGGCPSPACPPPPPVAPNAVVRMVRTDIDTRTLKDAVYHAVDHARHHIFLENPYFSDQILTKKLVAARARGVDVRAVLTLRGNVRQLNQFESLTANRLLRGGVRVFLFPAMTHVKAMSVDGVWAYIGTGNFDELSLRNNREVGLSVATPQIVQALDQSLFLPDLAASQELTAPLPWPKNRLLLEALSLWY
jgi:cardiolipin synthase